MPSTQSLIKIAHYYYVSGLTQQEIADKLNISRKTVNQAIKDAHKKGIVEIKINGYLGSYAELEQQLMNYLSLDDVLVADHSTPELFQTAVLDYLSANLKNGMNVGVNYGSTLANVFHNAPKIVQKNINVVQLVGGVNLNNIAYQSEEVGREFARTFGGKLYSLYTPNLVGTKELRDMIMNDPSSKEIMDMYSSLDFNVVAVGTIHKRDILLTEGYISKEEHDSIQQKGVVCDYCFRFLDVNGNIVDHDLENRVTGISTNELKKIPVNLCVSFGKEKVLSIIAAINGGYINRLITDEETAIALADYAASHQKQILPLRNL